MATKYYVSVWNGESWEGIALFSDKCDIDAMIMFCTHQFELGNSITTPAENIAITDIDTGEVLWDWIGDSQDDLDWPD